MDYEFLRGLSARPRVHPNGFVQLDLGENEKLHVWPEEPLKTVDVETPMHDHTFGFASTLLVGALRHTAYRPVESENGAYHLYTVFPYKAVNMETPFVRLDDKRYDMEIRQELRIEAGQSYVFDEFEFHSSHPIGLTATHIRVYPFDRGLQARVACRYDQVPQVFDRHRFDEEFLWSIIRKVFPK